MVASKLECLVLGGFQFEFALYVLRTKEIWEYMCKAAAC